MDNETTSSEISSLAINCSTRRYPRPPFLPLSQVLSVFRGFHTEGICQVCFSPDGKVKLSCVADRIALVGTCYCRYILVVEGPMVGK